MKYLKAALLLDNYKNNYVVVYKIILHPPNLYDWDYNDDQTIRHNFDRKADAIQYYENLLMKYSPARYETLRQDSISILE